MPHPDPVEVALGNIAAVSERITSGITPKLAPVERNPQEFDFMLATFCFDLARRMNYFFKATRGFAANADEALAREVFTDNQAINADGLTWEQRARVAEGIMLRLTAEIADAHDAALRAAAKIAR